MPTPATFHHLWVFNHPQSPMRDVWYCPFCKCWTNNKPAFAKEPCEERIKRIKECK